MNIEYYNYTYLLRLKHDCKSQIAHYKVLKKSKEVKRLIITLQSIDKQIEYLEANNPELKNRMNQEIKYIVLDWVESYVIIQMKRKTVIYRNGSKYNVYHDPVSRKFTVWDSKENIIDVNVTYDV